MDWGVANIQLPTALLHSVDPQTVDCVIVTVHFMMAYGGAKVKLHLVLTLIRYWVEGSVSRPGLSAPPGNESALRTWWAPELGLNVSEDSKCRGVPGNRTPYLSVVHPAVCSLYSRSYPGSLPRLKPRNLYEYFNSLKTKRRLLYLKTQSVPRCKYFSSRL